VRVSSRVERVCGTGGGRFDLRRRGMCWNSRHPSLRE
jgi:hypothetical protein